jgi:signal transduction histidine kinase
LQSKVSTTRLVAFAHLVSGLRASEDVLPKLADALQENVAPDGIAIVTIGRDGAARVAIARGLAATVADLEVDPDEMGRELGPTLLEACGEACRIERTLLLVASGNLFGAVVLAFRNETDAEDPERVAEGLVDLAALALGNAAYVSKLEQSYRELRASQEMLLRSEKLRALGEMAAGVSHDLLNILNPLTLHLRALERSLDRGKTADAKESIAEIGSVLGRGVETIRRLRDYGRQSPETKTERVDLAAIAKEAAGIAKPRLSSKASGARILVEADPAVPQVPAVSGEVLSAVVNLVVNAIDALARKAGNIRIRTGIEGAGAWIMVEDDGPGMPEDVRARVFEPFFTTKGEAGTGLGLAMVYACMQRHRGKATVESEPGKGTRFRLWFPFSDA